MLSLWKTWITEVHWKWNRHHSLDVLITELYWPHETYGEYSEYHTYQYHTAHLILWGPFGKDILASMISMCLFRTIQGWPSWKRLFALGFESFDEAWGECYTNKLKEYPNNGYTTWLIFFCRVEMYGCIAFFVSVRFRNKTNPETSSKTSTKGAREVQKLRDQCENIGRQIKCKQQLGKPSKEHLEGCARCSRELQNCETKNRKHWETHVGKKRKLGDLPLLFLLLKKMNENETLLLTRQPKSMKLNLLILSKRPKILEGKRLGKEM